jgi:glycosyltransferase involved in cell wall biosynthesis
MSASITAMHPSVSVVIPTFNRCSDVQRAIASVLAQTVMPSEIIVVDDGSTDGTELALHGASQPVTYVRKPNGGVSSARNFGMQRASGDFIFLLDSDDFWHARWVEQALAAIRALPGAGACVCTRLSLVDTQGNPLGERRMAEAAGRGEALLSDLFLGGVMGSNVCVRRDLLDSIGEFDSTLRTGEDMDFALRIAALARVAAVDEPLVMVTSTPGSLSKHINTGNRLRVYESFEQRFPELAARHRDELLDARVDATLGYARDLLAARQLDTALTRIRESWSYRPSWQAVKLTLKLGVLKVLGTKPSAGH